MTEEQKWESDKTKVINELAAAELLKLHSLKFTALEGALSKINNEVFKEYEARFNKLKESDAGLKELLSLMEQVRNSKYQ